MNWELWDGETGNMITVCTSEADALALVRRTIVEQGANAVSSWGLLQDGDELDDEQDLPPALSGGALIARAMGRVPTPYTG